MPRSKNGKADALSTICALNDSPELPENILDSKIFVNPIQWTPMENQANAPENPQPVALQIDSNKLIHTVHFSVCTGHPGANQTFLIQDCNWWPSMARDVRRFVSGCTDCTISKSPSGKLLPIAHFQSPWSHLGVDFITDLPPLQGNTFILVIVDQVQVLSTASSQGTTNIHGDCGASFQQCFATLVFLRTLCQTEFPKTSPESGRPL